MTPDKDTRDPDDGRDADLADDVDAWTEEPRDPDHGGPPAEYVDVPENTPTASDA